MTKLEFLKNHIEQKKQYIQAVMVPEEYFDDIQKEFPGMKVESTKTQRVTLYFNNGVTYISNWEDLNGE